ncbi:MAG: putative Xanthine dehydrogenase, molybdenum binding subunit apoprotein [Marmoricola sp.]|nr:putative Xanthine dehydrogenase, molybdenum binding subunit apoprotein [Marmoricola sp.]
MTVQADPRSDAGAFAGQSLRRHNGDDYVAGRIAYTDDLKLPGTTHVVLVRSEVPHARITVDTETALARPGVLMVATGRSLAEHVGPIPNAMDPAPTGGQALELRVLPVDKVVYVGQPLAAVVAETLQDALEAAAMVEVSYEPLPHVLEAEDALAENAPLLYESWGSNLMLAGTAGQGELEDLDARSSGVVRGTLRTGRGAPAPMEPRVYVADWSTRSRRLTWYGTTQAPHPLRHSIAQFLGLRERDVHVVAPPVGGSFGFKNFGHPEEYLVCVLSRLLGRPVKWVEDRASTLRYGARDSRIHYTASFDTDGRVTAVSCDLLANHGAASATGAFGMAFAGSLAMPSGYDVARFRCDWRVVVTNKGPWSPMRPFGKEAGVLLMETIMDAVARETGLDPLEVRRRNWVKPDQFPFVTATGLELDSGDYEGLLDKALTVLDYEQARREQELARQRGRFVGIGIGFEVLPEGADIPGALIGASDISTVRMDPSGDVTVLTGVTSPGNGNDTAIMQIVADRLGVLMDAVSIIQGDTDLCPFGFGNVSSRGILTGGGSAALAAEDVAAKLRGVAAGMLGCEDPDRIVLHDGFASVAGEPERALPVAAVAHALYTVGYIVAPDIEPTLEATRTFKMANIRHQADAEGRIMPFSTFSNGIYLSVVEVDVETGIVELKRHVMVHDCGVMINPRFVTGQFTGGVVHGIGAALTEEVLHAGDGSQVSSGFKTYLLPRANDIPAFEIQHQVTPSPFTPLGTKGAGEGGVACTMASLLNAVNDALSPLGATVDQLPAVPHRVLEAIRGVGR